VAGTEWVNALSSFFSSLKINIKSRAFGMKKNHVIILSRSYVDIVIVFDEY